MNNLQTEVLQMEYDEFAKGAQTITEVDFARILLRYTFLSSEEYKSILARGASINYVNKQGEGVNQMPTIVINKIHTLRLKNILPLASVWS